MRQVVTRTVTVCDRCPIDKELPATATRRFSIGDNRYTIDLCDRHLERFEREIGSWSDLAQLDTPFARGATATEIRDQHREAARLRAAQAPPTPPQAAPERPPAPEPTPAPTRPLTPRPAAIKPGVNIVPAPPRDFRNELLWTGDPESVDWTAENFDRPVTQLRDYVRDGLPEHVPLQYHPDVLGLAGVDLAAFDAAVRNPTRIEIRPESRAKKYPILGFYRGDIVAIMGFRTPGHPMMIAVYYDALLQHDTHRAGHAGTGGGGSREKQHGLPVNVRQLVRAIRAAGAEVEYGDDLSATVAEVKYRGQSLGKVSVGDVVPRATIQSDYQRIVRKIHAIDSRQGAVV